MMMFHFTDEESEAQGSYAAGRSQARIHIEV